MLYTSCRFDRAAHRGTVLDVTRTTRSPFAPSAELLADYQAGRCDWPTYELRYTQEMRALYRRAPGSWFALAHQAAAGDVTLVCFERGDEATVSCHRRLLKGMLFAVAGQLGLQIEPVAVDPAFPLKCVYCETPSPASSAIKGLDGYGVCSAECEAQEQARQWT